MKRFQDEGLGCQSLDQPLHMDSDLVCKELGARDEDLNNGQISCQKNETIEFLGSNTCRLNLPAFSILPAKYWATSL